MRRWIVPKKRLKATLIISRKGNIVEQGALMSANPYGMHEDPCCWLCVCLDVFEFVNPLYVMIQGCLISILFKNMCFLKKVKIQPVEMSIQPVVLHLVYLKKLDFV